jgi:hypothetical protein
MGKRATWLSLVLFVLLFTWADRSFSRARGPRTPAAPQRRAQPQGTQSDGKKAAPQQDARRIYDEYSDEAWQEILGAAPEQWQTIKPRLEKVRKAQRPPSLQPSVYGFGEVRNSYSNSFSNASGDSSGGSLSGGTATGTTGGGGGAGGGGYYSAGGGVGGGAGGAGLPSGARAMGGASGGRGGSFSSGGGGGGSSGGSSGYGFGFGGPPGPVKKKVGEVNLGWQWQRPSLKKSPEQLSENEKTCEQLLDLLETKSPDPEQVRQRLEALRKIRERIIAEHKEAMRQLREVVTPEQETKLVLMGYLD